VLIAGGNSKDLDVRDYAAEAAARAKRIILLAGNATNDFAAALRAAAASRSRPDDFIAGPYDSLPRALDEARAAADPGNVVLFSPGFTSFGLFLNEFDRGNQFRALVQALPPRDS
jgi:UDP-N-acetylmuramoylalanine--D-glutamate ligase